MSWYGIPATRVVAYTYEADYHCVEDALKRFGRDENGHVPQFAKDDEGNLIGAVFTSDMDVETVATCSDCGRVICLACGDTARPDSSDREIGSECWNCHTEWRIQE